MSGQARIVIVGDGIAFQLAGQGPSTLAPVRLGAEDFSAYATTRFERCKQLMRSATFATHLIAVSRSRAAP